MSHTPNQERTFESTNCYQFLSTILHLVHTQDTHQDEIVNSLLYNQSKTRPAVALSSSSIHLRMIPYRYVLSTTLLRLLRHCQICLCDHKITGSVALPMFDAMHGYLQEGLRQHAVRINSSVCDFLSHHHKIQQGGDEALLSHQWLVLHAIISAWTTHVEVGVKLSLDAATVHASGTEPPLVSIQAFLGNEVKAYSKCLLDLFETMLKTLSSYLSQAIHGEASLNHLFSSSPAAHGADSSVSGDYAELMATRERRSSSVSTSPISLAHAASALTAPQAWTIGRETLSAIADAFVSLIRMLYGWEMKAGAKMSSHSVVEGPLNQLLESLLSHTASCCCNYLSYGVGSSNRMLELGVGFLLRPISHCLEALMRNTEMMRLENQLIETFRGSAGGDMFIPSPLKPRNRELFREVWVILTLALHGGVLKSLCAQRSTAVLSLLSAHSAYGRDDWRSSVVRIIRYAPTITLDPVEISTDEAFTRAASRDGGTTLTEDSCSFLVASFSTASIMKEHAKRLNNPKDTLYVLKKYWTNDHHVSLLKMLRDIVLRRCVGKNVTKKTVESLPVTTLLYVSAILSLERERAHKNMLLSHYFDYLKRFDQLLRDAPDNTAVALTRYEQ